MRILITNDDGIRAEGLRALAEVARAFGEVKVVAPDRERSACGHSMTMHEPLRVREVEYDGLEAYMVSGVPVDCVNVGLTLAFPDGCDLVLSGFNHGPNLGFDITYSGTVAGAMEGTINGIRSIAVSMATLVEGQPGHIETGAAWLSDHLGALLRVELPELTLLNVNIPAIRYEEIRGTRVCAMGKRVYKDRVERRDDPWGRPYYWQGGVVVMQPDGLPNDVTAINQGYATVTPVQLDWTHHAILERVRDQFESLASSQSLSGESR